MASRRDFLAKLDETQPGLARAFVEAVRDLTSTAQIRALEDAIARQDIEAAIRALNLAPEFWAPLDRAISEAFDAGGVWQLANLPKPRSTGSQGPLVVRFQGRHPRAEAWARDRSSGLITEIVQDQREAVRETIREGLEEGANPRRTALHIAGRLNRATGHREGGIVGLTSAQAAFVRNLRRELSDPETASGYFDRKARDKRFDRTVAKSIREDKPLTQADVDRIARQYANRLLKLRGETIARTESIAALNAGRVEGMRQMIEAGKVDASAVTKVWSATMDGRTRDIHRAMNGQAERFDGLFMSPTGAMLAYPGDTGHGATGQDTINCRCWLNIKVDWLASVR